MSEAKILDCVHCGNEARIGCEYPDERPATGFRVLCAGCLMRTQLYQSEDYAIAAWNTLRGRGVQELVEALEDALATGEHDMQHVLDNGRLRDVLRAALAKWKGGE